jgi:HAD superfamily hydrolase (TIGR01509 family)
MILAAHRPYKAVLIDVDGTIALTEGRNRAVIEALAAEHGARISARDWESIGGQPEKVIWDWLAPRFPAFAAGIDPETFQLTSRARALKSDFNVAARPGIAQTIDYFKAQGLRVVAVSNSPRDCVEKNLRMAGCLDKIEFMVTETEVLAASRRQKPHPDPYHMAADALGLAPEECIVFEDSQVGAQAGRDFGATVIQFIDAAPLPETRFADIYVRNGEKELPALCRKLVPPRP